MFPREILLYVRASTDKKKPFTSKDGSQDEKCRYVTTQRLKTGNEYNMRKLLELPVQLMEAGMTSEFERNVIMSLEWHFAKLKAFSYR